MKIGVCGGIDRAEAIKRQGYDYIEENLAKIAALSDSEFSERVRAYEKLDLPVYSFNSFFGPDNRIYDEDGLESVKAYAEKALYRARAIGGSICVLGSGKQRNIVEGLDRGFAEQRFCDVLSLVGDIAEKNNIRIAIEPLNTNETNLINKVSEGSDFARRAGKKSIGVLVDFFHLFMVNERDSALEGSEDILWHAHIARANADRRMPMSEDLPTLEKWVEMLKKANYKGNITLEGKYLDFESDIAACRPYVELFRNI